jgi:hypothetical protein
MNVLCDSIERGFLHRSRCSGRRILLEHHLHGTSVGMGRSPDRGQSFKFPEISLQTSKELARTGRTQQLRVPKVSTTMSHSFIFSLNFLILFKESSPSTKAGYRTWRRLMKRPKLAVIRPSFQFSVSHFIPFF